jgi:L-2,4-diaminobutyric acid acetyltransferase
MLSPELLELAVPVLRTPETKDKGRVTAPVGTALPRDTRGISGTVVGQDAFHETSVLAEMNGELLGRITGYLLPYDPETLFIWHIEVSDAAPGTALSMRMLRHLLQQKSCAGVTRVQTVISSDDEAPWLQFRQFAGKQNTSMDIQPYYTQALEPHKRHENDNLVTICLQSHRSPCNLEAETLARSMDEMGRKSTETDSPYTDAIATVGDRILAARKSAELSQRDLASRLGVKLNTIQNWENDQMEPRANKTQMASGVLGVSFMWLLTGQGEGIPDLGKENRTPASLSDMISEIRNLKSDISQSTRKLSNLEKKLQAAV